MGGIEQLIEDWDGAAVVQSFDRDTSTWIFVALHDASLGTPAGGTRMKVYRSPISPSGTGLPLSSRRRTSYPASGLPEVPGRTSPIRLLM